MVLSYLRNDTIYWIVITKTNKTVLMSNSIPGEIKRKVEWYETSKVTNIIINRGMFEDHKEHNYPLLMFIFV